MLTKSILFASIITLFLLISCTSNDRSELGARSENLAASVTKTGELLPTELVPAESGSDVKNMSALAVGGIYLPKYIKNRLSEEPLPDTSVNSLRDIPGIYTPKYIVSKVNENQQQKTSNLALKEQ